MKERFASFTDDQIKSKCRKTIPQSTLKCNTKWDKVFRTYLFEKGCQSTEYWCYPDDQLDAILGKFWFEV